LTKRAILSNSTVVNFERLKKMENKTVIDKPQTAKAEVKTKLKKSNFNLKPRLTAEKESS